MSVKFFGGVAIGAIVGGSIVYTSLNKKIKQQNIDAAERIEEHEKEVANILEARDEIISDYEKEIAELKKTVTVAVEANINAGVLCNNGIELYRRLLDPDMLADIADIDDGDYRDECLSVIDDVASTISAKISNVNFANISNNDLGIIMKEITDNMDDATDKIKDVIDTYQSEHEDEEDDDENEVTTITPGRVIVDCLDGTKKFFNAEPDDGFEIIDGSNPTDNEFCIDAQNIPELYKFMFDSIKDQLSYHYVAEIDGNTFERLIEDMTIIVTLSYVNDDSMDMVVTAVNAVVPFELFGESIGDKMYKIYSIEGGELDLANALDYFRSNHSDRGNEDRETNTDESSIKTEKPIKNEEEVVKPIQQLQFESPVSDDAIQFVIETVGYNRDSLMSFIGNLKVLMKVNSEAAESIYSAYSDIITEIQDLNNQGKLTDIELGKYYTSIKAIHTNMKKNYGSAIKSYKQSMREKAAANE